MNSRWHLVISITKSMIRIVGCIAGIYCSSVRILAVSLLGAEILGIAEELGDER